MISFGLRFYRIAAARRVYLVDGYEAEVCASTTSSFILYLRDGRPFFLGFHLLQQPIFIAWSRSL